MKTPPTLQRHGVFNDEHSGQVASTGTADQLYQLIDVVEACIVQDATLTVYLLVLALPLQNGQELRLQVVDYLHGLARRNLWVGRLQQGNRVGEENGPETER